MTNILSYIFGILAGAVLVIASGLFFNIYPGKILAERLHKKQFHEGESYQGDIPDFSTRQTEVNLFDRVSPEWMVTSPDGEEFPFHALEGKVLFLSRWATWCGPCIAEMPEVAALRSSLPQDKVVFMLYTDEQEYIVRAFDNKHEVPIYTSVGYLPEYLDVHSLPETFIVDKNGVIRYRHNGVATWSDQSVVDFMNLLISSH